MGYLDLDPDIDLYIDSSRDIDLNLLTNIDLPTLLSEQRHKIQRFGARNCKGIKPNNPKLPSRDFMLEAGSQPVGAPLANPLLRH